jgi:hypothetical protein
MLSHIDNHPIFLFTNKHFFIIVKAHIFAYSKKITYLCTQNRFDYEI